MNAQRQRRIFNPESMGSENQWGQCRSVPHIIPILSPPKLNYFVQINGVSVNRFNTLYSHVIAAKNYAIWWNKWASV